MKKLVLLWRRLFRHQKSTPKQEQIQEQQVLVSRRITRPLAVPGASHLAHEAHVRRRLEPDIPGDEEDITNQVTQPLPVIRLVEPPVASQRRLLLGSGTQNHNEPTIAEPVRWMPYNDDTVRVGRPVDRNATLPMSLAEIMR
jgi:hypothetical protein